MWFGLCGHWWWLLKLGLQFVLFMSFMCMLVFVSTTRPKCKVQPTLILPILSNSVICFGKFMDYNATDPYWSVLGKHTVGVHVLGPIIEEVEVEVEVLLVTVTVTCSHFFLAFY